MGLFKFKSATVKDVPQRAYACIITEHGVDPDWAYTHLKCVEEHDKLSKTHKYRVFDTDIIPKGFTIESYASFDARPELVMFEGYSREAGAEVQTVMEKKSVKPTPGAA
jgi:hypothetical protein